MLAAPPVSMPSLRLLLIGDINTWGCEVVEGQWTVELIERNRRTTDYLDRIVTHVPRRLLVHISKPALNLVRSTTGGDV